MTPEMNTVMDSEGGADQWRPRPAGMIQGLKAGTLEKFDLGCRRQGELADIHARAGGRKCTTGYLAAEFLVFEHDFRQDTEY